MTYIELATSCMQCDIVYVKTIKLKLDIHEIHHILRVYRHFIYIQVIVKESCTSLIPHLINKMFHMCAFNKGHLNMVLVSNPITMLTWKGRDYDKISLCD